MIPNDRLLALGDRGISMMDAFRQADQVLLSGVQGITDLITTPGLINLDFADVKSVMSGAGSALMGIGSARGDNRAVEAAERAISSPLLEQSMDGARGVLLSIAGGSDLGLFEINDAAQLVTDAAHSDANIIFGAVIDDALGDEVRVTVIAAGFDGGAPAYRPADAQRRVRRRPAGPSAPRRCRRPAPSSRPAGCSSTTSTCPTSSRTAPDRSDCPRGTVSTERHRMSATGRPDGRTRRPGEIAANLAAVRERIAAACAAAGRDPAEVTLVAVTKTYPAADVRAPGRAGRDRHRGEPGPGGGAQGGRGRRGRRRRPVALRRPAAAQQVPLGGAGTPTWCTRWTAVRLAEALGDAAGRARERPLEVLVQVSLDGDPTGAGRRPARPTTSSWIGC